MMDVIKQAANLNLPDWWICAGFIRSKVWDVQFGKNERTLLDDIDVIYYDSEFVEERIEKTFEEQLRNRIPGPRWSVKNQARMHVLDGVRPYRSSVDGIANFPETATALGVKMSVDGLIIVTAPWGTNDVLNGIIRPTPPFMESEGLMTIFEKRLLQKNWVQTWPGLQVVRE